MKLNLMTALCNRNGYSVQESVTAIREMCRGIDYGQDPEELLEQLGLEPDYVMDLLDYYSDYMDEQELRMEDAQDGIL